MTPTSPKAQRPPRAAGAASDVDPAFRRPAAAKPTGKHAPTEPPKQVDPKVQAAAETVEPAAGYALVRLMMAEQRHDELDLPDGTVAMLELAMVRVLRLHHSDDLFAREYPPSSVIFASLEGLAPLLGSYCFLLPVDRVQGVWPGEAQAGEAMGFHD